MTVYVELLKAELAEAVPEAPTTQLVGRVLTTRSRLGLDSADSATRLSRLLAYDVALVRLCEALGISHRYLSAGSPEEARAEAEESLAGRLPALAVERQGV